jgi:hypothetical protein
MLRREVSKNELLARFHEIDELLSIICISELRSLTDFRKTNYILSEPWTIEPGILRPPNAV